MRETIAGVFKAIIRFILEAIIWDFVLFQLGRVVMLIVTLGRRPSRQDCHQNRDQWPGGL